MDLFLQEHHTAEEDGVDDLLLTLEVDIQCGLAVFRYPRDIVHGRLLNALLCKQPLGGSQYGTTMKLRQRLLLAHLLLHLSYLSYLLV